MDVNGLRFTDEFRMRSPVVWLCFAIVVLCALSVESKRSYHIVHGQAGPIIRSVVPSIGYTNVGVGPHFVGRRQQRQDDYDYEEGVDEDDDLDEDVDYSTDYNTDYNTDYGDGAAAPLVDYQYDDEDEDEEEGEDDADNEEYADSNFATDDLIQGRQAYVNNHFIDDPYAQRQRPQYNRVPLRSSTRKPPKTRPTKNSSHKKKPSNGHKRKPTSPLADLKPQSSLPIKKKEKEVIAASTVTISPLSVLQPSSDKQKIQLRPVATSTQFIATPVADLILRLSISLAKPIGQGNSTTFNVPIRIHQGALQNAEDSKVIQTDLELSRPDNMSVVTAPSADKDALEDDTDVDDVDETRRDEEQTAEIPVTELSRK